MNGRTFLRRSTVLLAFVAPAYVILVHPTLDLIRGNREHFAAGYAAGWSMYLAALLLITGGVTLWRLRRFPAARFLTTVYLLSGVGWFLYTFAALALNMRLWLLAGLVTTLVVAGVRMRDTIEDSLQTLGVAGLMLVVGLSSSFVFGEAPGIAGLRSPEQGTDGAEESPTGEPQVGSDLPNVYHLVFDEFQTEMFEVARTEELENELSGFRSFDEASTPFGRTEMAMASVFASRPYDYDEPLREYIERAFTDEDSLVGLLDVAGYRTAGWLHGLEFFGWTSPFDRTYLHHEIARSRSSLVEQSTLVRSTWAHTHLPTLLAEPLMPASHFEQLERGALLSEDAPPSSVESFREFLAVEADLPGQGRYTMVHLIVPHLPYVLDGDCEVVPGGSTPREQTDCALRLVREFTDRLRELDRYDDALIVIQGDHGGRFELQGGELADVEDQGRYSEAWSRARSRPLLLLKPPGAPDAPLAVSNVPATLEDVLPTIADALGWDHAPPEGRASLLSEEFPDRPTRYYHFYDKDRHEVIDGDLQRYVIEGDRLRFDQAIPVPIG